VHSEGESEDDDATPAPPPKKPAARGRAKATGTTRKTAPAPTKKAPAPRAGRGKKTVVEESDDEEKDEDVIMIDDDEDEEEEDGLFVKPAKTQARKLAAKTTVKAKALAKKAPARNASQATLDLSQARTQRGQTNGRSKKVQEPVSAADGVSVLSRPVHNMLMGIRATTKSPMMTMPSRRCRPREAPAAGDEKPRLILCVPHATVWVASISLPIQRSKVGHPRRCNGYRVPLICRLFDEAMESWKCYLVGSQVANSFVCR
jgi:hypothetical protein